MLTDTHCHLDHEKFFLDLEAVLERAIQAGVGKLLIPGTTLASSQAALDLARGHSTIFAAVGIHPTECKMFDEKSISQLRDLAKSPKVVAIGEIGLDYYWDTAPHDLQKKVLIEQLSLAGELQKPVVLHFREKGDAVEGPCAADLLEILDNWTAGLRSDRNPLAERPGVLHSFSGSPRLAEQVMGINFYLGVTGPVTYRKGRGDLIASLPLESLLIETDSPFMAPDPYRGKRNEPAYVRLIADKIAVIHACTIEEVAKTTSENASLVFNWES